MEATIEATSSRGNRPDDNSAWLPRYFAQWRGGSLVGDDPVVHEMTAGGIAATDSSLRPLPPAVQLLYGRRYSFRVRLADLSGGGPDSQATPVHAGAAAVATLDFVRHVPPKAVRVETDPARPPTPPPPTTPGELIAPIPVQTLTAIRVLRPLIGYPEMRFAGLSDADLGRFRQQIAQGITLAPGAPAPVFGIPDPDVDTLRIAVEARSLAHDAGGAPGLDGPYRILYELDVPFPPAAADPLADGAPLALSLDYVDHARVSSINAPTPGQNLPIPTARDVRLRLTGVCKSERPGYFGSASARLGITVDLATRREAMSEEGLLRAVGAQGVEALLLQPGSDAAARIAQHLDIQATGLSFTGRSGSRTVFAASRFVRHTLTGDGATLTLASGDELLNRWIVAIRFDMARDWTWDGLADTGVIVERDDAGPIGAILVPGTVAAAALADGDENQRRELTHLIFLDAIDPLPAAGSFPREALARYRLRPIVKAQTPIAAIGLPDLRLPVTVSPAQTPKLASAGVALSKYAASADYSSTESRRRALWLEFEQPVADPNDVLFGRVLAYAPDPLLAPTQPDLADEPPISLPDENVRAIVPGQSRDDAGLAAMTRLQRSPASDRHFLLPLPDGVDSESLLLFGLWTYEFRVGHAEEWSTARARFGWPLRVAGVQHPAPTLVCTTGRVAPDNPQQFGSVAASAPLATPVALDGTRLLPQEALGATDMYFLLYAQARQADAKAWRNILLLTVRGDREGVSPERDRRARGRSSTSATSEAFF